MPDEAYYRADLAMVHHLGFGVYADMVAPGVLRRLEPMLGRTVVELGCGSGALTRHLVAAGHQVIATDASPAMLDLTRAHVPEADVRRLVLPDDPIPAADVIVSTGHVLNYLSDDAALRNALAAVGRAVNAGGMLLLDLCDLAWAEARRDAPAHARQGDGWAIITEYSVPSPDRFVRDITTFLRNDDGSWRRDSERHANVMIDVTEVPALLATARLDAGIEPSFGDERLPEGLVVVAGRRTSSST